MGSVEEAASSHMGLGARDRKSRSFPSVVALLMALLGAPASRSGAAEQIVLGKSFVVKDPARGLHDTLRSVVTFGKERTSIDTIVGDPVTRGATVEIVANGATSTDQLFILPPELPGTAGRVEDSRSPVVGYSYEDSLNERTAKQALIERVGHSWSRFSRARPGPQPHIMVVPPAPTDGDATINGGIRTASRGGQAEIENTPSSGTPNKEFVVSSAAMLDDGGGLSKFSHFHETQAQHRGHPHG